MRAAHRNLRPAPTRVGHLVGAGDGRLADYSRLPFRARRTVAYVLALALAFALAGCSASDDPRVEMRRAVRLVAVTLASAAMTVEVLQRIPATATTADLALADDAQQIDAAEQRILLARIGRSDEATRRSALRLVREAAAELADTQAQVAAAVPGRPIPTEDLRYLADRLLVFSDEMADR